MNTGIHTGKVPANCHVITSTMCAGHVDIHQKLETLHVWIGSQFEGVVMRFMHIKFNAVMVDVACRLHILTF